MSSIAIGIEEGAKWGAAGGTLVEPGGGTVVGGIAGGIVGGLLVVGVAIGGKKLYDHLTHANSKAEEKLKDDAQDQACATCAKDIPCFKTPKNGSPAEMDKQLKEQEDKINSMDPEEVEKNIDKFQQEGRPNDSSARSNAREQASSDMQGRLSEQYRAEGLSPGEADTRAAQETSDFMRGQDATHDLDWVAGGDGAISGTGGSSENRSIGSQWAKPGDGETGTRAQNLRDEAEKAKKAGKKKMNVKLKRC